MTDPWLFVLAVATLLLTPGPTNTLVATSGSLSGVRASLQLLAAELVAYLIAVSLVRLALAPLLTTMPAVVLVLKLVVIAWLLWLAFRLWRRPGLLQKTAQPVTFASVFVTTLLNPKALIFGLAVIPAEPLFPAGYFAGFAAMVPLAGLIWIGIGRGVGTMAGRHAVLMPRVAAIALVIFTCVIARSLV